MNIYDIAWYFLIYSFAGWCAEVIFNAVVNGRIINSGMLVGPVCPIYGCGVCALFLLGNTFSSQGLETMNALQLFIFGTVVCTIVELITGYALDKLWHVRWWDYSSFPFNFHGYICLGFSLLWGFGVLLVVHYIHPAATLPFTGWLPEKIGVWILAVLYLVFITDVIITFASLIGLHKKIKRLDTMKKKLRGISDNLSQNIGENALGSAQRVQKGRVQVELGRKELEDKTNEAIEILNRKIKQHWLIQRFSKAFPDLHSYETPETLATLLKEIREKR